MPKLAICLAVALTASSSAWADEGETDRLADRADAVVVGELLSGQQAGHSLSFVLSVTRILKGDLTAGATVNVAGRTGLSLSRSLRGHYGIWFLQKTGTQWRLLPLLPGAAALETSGYLPVSKLSSPASVVTSSPPRTANDRIAIEMAAAIQSYTDRKQLFNLAYGLQGATESGFLRDIYLSLRTNFDPEIRFIGLSRPFGPDDDLLTLAEIANNLDLVLKLQARGILVPSICGRTNSDPRAVQYLGRLAQSSDVAVQRCSAMAMMYIHSRESLPLLAGLLDATDPKTREYAMGGLSRFVDNLPIPSAYNVTNGKALLPQGPQPYRTMETDKYSLSTGWLGRADQTEHLRFWKSWWASMRNQLINPTPSTAPTVPRP